MTTGGSRPGTAHDAMTASVRLPALNQCAPARSMLAATHWNGMVRSSKVAGRWLASNLRSGAGEYRWVR